MPRGSSVRFITWINIWVFLAWLVSAGTLSNESFMVQNFLVSWQGLQEGRVWTLLTSVFSHNSFLHILLNMYVLNNFGPVLENVLGRREFMRFYLIAGAVSSFCHALVSAFLLGQPELPALGASGSISGLILVFSLLFPRQVLLLFGFIPVRAIVGAFIFVGLDIWGLISQAEGGGLPIGHGAHLGGALCGLIFYFTRLRPRMKMRRYSV